MGIDQDLAAIYGYEVKRLNEQVKRNISRFPEDFMFQIEPEEVPDRLKSQIATLNGSNNKRGMRIKKMPYAFTEQGIYIGNEEYRSVENETLLTFFLIDELINISYNMANIY